MADFHTTVTVIDQFLLQCSNEGSLRNLTSPVPLGPMDQRSLLAIPLAVVFVYRQEQSAVQELIPIDRFQRALSRLLDYYPHLTGRIIISPKDQTPQISQLGAGAKLVSAQCNKPLQVFESIVDDDKPGSPPRLIGTNLPDGGNALLPFFDPTEAGAAHDSILTVQHTRFACGGVSVAIRLRHIICDAAGFFQLARDLAELYRGFHEDNTAEVTLSSPAPEIHSYMSELRMSTQELQQARDLQPTVFELTPETPVTVGNDTTETLAPVIGRILRFSLCELAAIKAEANAGNHDSPLSTFCALTAHVWQSIYRTRAQLCESQGMSPSEAALHVPRQFLASVDLRSRNQLNVSSRYFPNCVLCPVFSLPASELLDAPLSTVAAAVHEAVHPLDQAEVQQNLRWLAAQPDKQRVRLRYRYEEGGVMVSQWNKFGMYRGTEMDISPALVAQPFTPISLIDGLIYFMATEDQLEGSDASTGITAGSIDVSLALSDAAWSTLDEDTRFRRHRSW
ncbi:hypothetical protein PRNP1_005574 [Phytophthora ramorum]